MNEESKINKLIIKAAYVLIIVLIIAVIALLILKYEVEGEQNMPFKLSSILVLSNAEGYQEKQNDAYMWDVEIYQNNDIYINIEKNKNYKDSQIIDSIKVPEIIKSIKIDNIQIDKNPQVGIIELYRSSTDNLQTYKYQDEYKIQEKIEYFGDISSDIKNLKISNQGGTLILRVLNKTGRRYTSNEKEFEHNGKLLDKVELTYEQIKSEISFDLTISLESGINYKANIQLDLPVGDIAEEGSSSLEITNMKDIVFKRE